MNREELTKRYLEAWSKKDMSGLLKLMHPQASYYDAFWGETCSGSELPKYLGDNFALETRWYRPDDELVATQNGLIIRYVAFDLNDPEGLMPIYNGAEVITISDGLIMTISDFYCDPDPVDLIEIATRVEKQHSRSNIVPLGLSARTSGRIQRQWAELATTTTVFLNPSLTVTQLADRVGCSVMHLFHVLEEERETTFRKYVNECRARYATTLLVDASNGANYIRQIADQSGFASVEELDGALQSTFGLDAKQYVRQFSK